MPLCKRSSEIGFSDWTPVQVARRTEYECGTEPVNIDPGTLFEIQPTVNAECNQSENYRPLGTVEDYFPADAIMLALHFIYNPNYVDPPFPNANGGGSYMPCDNGLGGMPATPENHPCFVNNWGANATSGTMHYNNAYELVAEVMQKLNADGNAYPFMIPAIFPETYVHSPNRRYKFYLIDVDQTSTLPPCAGNTLTDLQRQWIGGNPKKKGIFFHLDPAYPLGSTRGFNFSLENIFGIPYVFDAYLLPRPTEDQCKSYGGAVSASLIDLEKTNIKLYTE